MDLTKRIILHCQEPQRWHWTDYYNLDVYESQLSYWGLIDQREWLLKFGISLHRDCVRMRTKGSSMVALTWWAEMDHPTWIAYKMTFG